ncbi:MAG: SPASM domain-containing protein, partial [Acidobacteriota bacterium]
TTNATLMRDDGLMRKLVQKLACLVVSFDAATKQTYESIRVGANYDKVISNIKRFNRFRTELPAAQRPKLYFSYVLMHSNIGELPEFVRLAHELQADGIGCAHVVIYDPQIRHESLLFHKEAANRSFIEASSVASSVGVALSLPPLYSLGAQEVSKETTSSGRIECPFLWNRSWIDWNGDVVPCCNGRPGRPYLGNVRQSSFKEIWNGKVYQAMRKGLATGEPFDFCKHCYIAVKDSCPDDEKAFIAT